MYKFHFQMTTESKKAEKVHKLYMLSLFLHMPVFLQHKYKSKQRINFTLTHISHLMNTRKLHSV